jgi:uncharacterized protein (DUF1499 family)
MLCSLALVAIVSADVWAKGTDSSKSLIRPCPNKPNCISSRAKETSRKVAPIPYQGSFEDARRRLLDVILSFPRSIVVQDKGNYLKVEFHSAIFAFVDDVEFEFDDVSKLIDFRSASRLGYYDFGVNRRRMEAVTLKFSSK